MTTDPRVKSSLQSDLVSAVLLLTRLPVRGTPTARAADAAWAWPLAGLAVASIAGAAGLAVWATGAQIPVAAAVVLALQVALTGALHEDGLADTADGIWGGATPARRLEIMRDSRIGTYGVVALVLSLLLRWSLIATALIQGQLMEVILIAAVVSRAPMAVAMRWLPPARADGLSHSAGRPPAWAAQAGVAMAVVALALAGGRGLAAAVLVTAIFLALGRLARRKIGGQTGDVVGAVQQLSEIAVLVALTAG